MPSPLPGAVSRVKYRHVLTGKDVYRLRRKHGLSLRQLEKLTDVDRAHLSRIENLKAAISDRLALKLRRALMNGKRIG